jgi:SNF2 family DNA or RNA helicase
MSPIAAGMGLNVTAANHVIHFSRHWNPAKENQATDRAYRIGQTKDVFVYYPMATSPNFKSFDETLDELLSRKTTLATSTIFPTERIEVSPDDFGLLFV